MLRAIGVSVSAGVAVLMASCAPRTSGMRGGMAPGDFLVELTAPSPRYSATWPVSIVLERPTPPFYFVYPKDVIVAIDGSPLHTNIPLDGEDLWCVRDTDDTRPVARAPKDVALLRWNIPAGKHDLDFLVL